jgi:rubredoxin
MSTPVTDSEQALIEAVAKGLDGLDGVTSPQTRQLLTQWKTETADMSVLWAMTPPTWACPGCGRTKPDLVRLNRNGALMCRLDSHHDHMEDALVHAFELHSTSQDKVVANRLGLKFAKRAVPVVSAFDRTVVCCDCNSADTAAKAVTAAHRYLSFSAQEIRHFVRARPNAPHDIDEQAAHEIYAGVDRRFRQRMKLVDKIASIAARDDHWFQQAPEGAGEAFVGYRAEVTAHSRNLSTSFHVLCGDRAKAAVDPARWRSRRHPAPRLVPTARQIAYVAKAQSDTSWNRVPEDWTCPGCGREKVSCVRGNKAGTWSLSITENSFRPEDHLPHVRSIHVCGDCRDTAICLGKEASALSGVTLDTYLNRVHLSEVRHIVRPQVHGRHNYHAKEAASVVATVALRLQATAGAR